MAKSRRRLAAHLKYNRPSRGYKINLARKSMKDAGVPKRRDTKKLLRILKIILIAWAILTVIDTIVEGISGFGGMMILGVFIAYGVLIYISQLPRAEAPGLVKKS